MFHTRYLFLHQPILPNLFPSIIHSTQYIKTLLGLKKEAAGTRHSCREIFLSKIFLFPYFTHCTTDSSSCAVSPPNQKTHTHTYTCIHTQNFMWSVSRLLLLLLETDHMKRMVLERFDTLFLAHFVDDETLPTFYKKKKGEKKKQVARTKVQASKTAQKRWDTRRVREPLST